MWGIPHIDHWAWHSSTLVIAVWERRRRGSSVSSGQLEAIERAVMLTPTATESPLHLEPTSAASFIDRGLALSRDRRTRELDHRRADGIDVRLLWSQPDERILLVVSDSKTGDAFSVEVEPGDALEAFHHPYSYAAFKHAA
jgi:hypothetical protein